MPIPSPAGPIATLEETVFAATKYLDVLGQHYTDPVMLVVAPHEEWAETTAARITLDADMISVKMMPTLVLPLRSPNGGQITFGRAPQNLVVLPFAAISKEHGYLVEASGSWHIADIGSKNGTYVDGTRVPKATPTPLRDGASVRFGDVSAKFWLPKSFCIDLERRIRGTLTPRK